MVPKYKRPTRIPSDHGWINNEIKSAPKWCSVDLRDGNQALPMPMNPAKKLEYFKLLTKVGFKEIEVSFPSASQDDFQFVRNLIENNEIPDDVQISVLTQIREDLIRRTVESLKGVKKATFHSYVATSDLHSILVLKKTRPELIRLAVEGTKLIHKCLEEAGLLDVITYEFSPEEFTDSDLDFVLDLCKQVKEAWGPSAKDRFILNLPATVERRPPWQYADMIACFISKYPYMSETTISVHSHNDQGCAVASTEMTLLAGAERVEGTLFGHGERTGNVDICTMALNLESLGIPSGLDFSNLPAVVRAVEAASGIDVHPRHPYAGQLVFTAFSGSHQDAIRKGLDQRERAPQLFQVGWKVPYLHIDPADLGRSYEKLIRINSQSGKGGVAYVLEHEYDIHPPKGMHPEVGHAVQEYTDKKGDEINSSELINVFRDNFVNVKGAFELLQFNRIDRMNEADENSEVRIVLKLRHEGHEYSIEGTGNGPLSATVNAIRDQAKLASFILEDFAEKTMGSSADAKAIAFVGIRRTADQKLIYGAGEHSNIDQAAVYALFSALNRAYVAGEKEE